MPRIRSATSCRRPASSRRWSCPTGEGIRVDTGVEAGSVVSPYYDPMIAKVIAHGADRGRGARRGSRAALGETVVVGPHANAAFLKALVAHPEFRAGRFDTGFIERNLAELTRVDPAAEAAAIGAAVEALLRAAAGRGRARRAWRDPWAADDGFALGPRAAARSRHHGRRASAQGDGRVARRRRSVTVDGVRGARKACASCRSAAASSRSGSGVQRHVALKSYDSIDVDHLDGDGVVKAPMHGKVLAIFVAPGASVTKGERVAVVEAMKMEHALLAPLDGMVERDRRRGRRAGRRRREDPDDRGAAANDRPRRARNRDAEKKRAQIAENRAGTSTGRAARAKCVAMPLHLLKLCVGCNSVKDLEDWIKQRLKQKKKERREAGAHPHHPDGAEARRRTDRRRLALLGDQRRDPLPRAAARRSGRSPTRTASAAAGS